jgi:glycine oxidase
LREATGVDVAYRDDGALALAFNDEEAEHLLSRLAWQRDAGLRVERLTSEEVRAREPALAPCVMALRFADDHQVDNLLVVRALTQAVARAGIPIVGAHARRLQHDGTRVTGVELDGATRQAAHVVLACGSWSALVEGTGLPARAVAPVRGQMIELETRPTPLSHVIFGDEGYLVPRRDGRVLCGSTEEHTWDKQVTPAGLERLVGRVRRLCPSLAEAPIARSWSGLRPGTPDGLPLLGPSPLVGLHLATGHYRNGILLLPITTEIVTASVTGDAPPLPLAPFAVARLS